MAQEISHPPSARRWVARNSDGSVLHQGLTEPVHVTITGQEVLEQFGDEPSLLTALTSFADKFPPLPAAGEPLRDGEKYRHNDEVVAVRQSHRRTTHEPDDVPALFLTVRTPADGIEWIEGERVVAGDVRSYLESNYRCIQGHVTQADWTPPDTPALWAEVVTGSGDWQAGVAYAVDDEVSYSGETYRCLQAHTALVGWEPPNVPALWELVSAGGIEWQAGVAYAVNDEVTYEGTTYRCLQAHTSQIGWEPPNVPALWAEV